MGEQCTGGRGGIRTHGTLAGTPVFKTGALNHSATLPSLQFSDLAGVRVRGKHQSPLEGTTGNWVAVPTCAPGCKGRALRWLGAFPLD
jgi:hypothetical protein